MTIGVLAFQGDVIEHMRALATLDVSAKEVRSLADFEAVDGLIIPGGESTVIAKFLTETGLRDRIIERSTQNNFPIYGTCAGAILLSTKVVREERFQPMGLIDIDVERNAYGRQSESFEAELTILCHGERSRTMTCRGASLDFARDDTKIYGTFIRAPKIVRTGEEVEILAEYEGEPVLVRQGKVLVSTFHPELTDAFYSVYGLFLEIIDK